jgi:quinoprotein glucose dehydrogenase
MVQLGRERKQQVHDKQERFSRSFWRKFASLAGIASVVLAGFVVLLAQSSTRAPQPYTTWTHPNGSIDALQYSALDQINKENVSQLQQVWFYPVPGENGRFGFSPLIVGDMMYVLGKDNAIVALDAATGKEIWSHPVKGTPTARGINYWQSKDGSDRRLFFGASGNLQAIDARTGKQILSFGDNGMVNMREGDFRPLGGPSSTPGRVFENLLIVGSGAGEGYDATLGDIRAYNVETGKLVWTFHTIPRPGEDGYNTWPKDAYKNVGNVGSANVWGEISVDEKRGIVYLPTGSAAYDFYGGERIGANLFADCLLALDARTGKRLWYFQVVHHDLWDYDLTTAPKLLTVRHNGKMVDVVAEPTKFGFLYVFNRVTGEPLWPIEERPVPKSDVPGEEAYPTQPFPTNPPPFARQKFTVDDINPYIDPKDKERLRDILLHARNEGLFTPPAMHNTIDMPGELGGANWGGAAGDPETGMLYVRSIDAPTMHILSNSPRVNLIEGGTPAQHGHQIFSQTCAVCHGEDRAGTVPPKQLGEQRFRDLLANGNGQMPAFKLEPQEIDDIIAYLNDPAAGALPATAGRPPRATPPPSGHIHYYTPYGTLDAENGLPAIGPPWSQITAYDLNQGTIKWQIPFGTVTSLEKLGIKNTGSYHPTRNGLVVTKGGLIFAGTWSDRTLHAYDKDTGKVLWEQKLASGPEGIPAVFELNGRQYIAFTARTGQVFDNIYKDSIAWEKGDPQAAGYYVFALPQTTSQTKSPQ